MRCETSFFSPTLYKKHLQRYWPMWAVWLAGWLLAMPVQMWNENGLGRYEYVAHLAEEYVDWLTPTSVLIAVAAPIVAVAVFFHLFRAPAANFIGALPLLREGAFATAFAAGLTILLAPLTVVSLITWLLECTLGVACGAVFQWLGGCALLCFFWFSFATLCCVISGNGVAGVCFYGIFNGVCAGMTFLIQAVLGEFLYGFSQFTDGVWKTVGWLTPIYATVDGIRFLETPRFEILGIYAGVGFLMALAALGLHHIRKSERAGDLIAFVPIRWAFRVSVTLCGGLSLGLLLEALLLSGQGMDNGPALAACCAVAAAISWFVAEMLLQKSLKVFKRAWKGAVIGGLCFILAIAAVAMDWVGFTTRVPDPTQVKSAYAEFYGASDPIAMNGLIYEGEDVQALTDLHRCLVDNRDTGGGNYCRMELEYDLGLTRLRREYGFSYAQMTQVDALRAAAIEAGRPDFDITVTPTSADFQTADGSKGLDLTPTETERLWAAVKEDVAAGRYRPQSDWETAWGDYVEFQFPQVDNRYGWRMFYLRDSTTSANAAIDALGLREKATGDQAVDTVVYDSIDLFPASLETPETSETPETIS